MHVYCSGDSFVSDSISFGTTGLIGAPTATPNMSSADVAATGEFALSTLASVSASKLKEKLREKLVSGGSASQSDIQDFQAAQAELQAVGVEVRLIENPHPHHNQQQQEQKHQHQQPVMENSASSHAHHITLEDPTIISSVSSPASAIISHSNQSQQHQQTQNNLTQAVAIQNSGSLQLSGPTPQQLFRAHIINSSDSSNPLKRRLYSSGNNSNNGSAIGNSNGSISTIFPIPVSLNHAQTQPPAQSLSNPVTVLTGPSVVGGSVSPSSPNSQWVSEKQALEREKLQAEVEVLRLQRVKLKLEIEALLQQRQPESCQLLEDYLK
ncbi:hypothetical protein ElyMa_006557000 [Elysia marginata]|uniref:cGMP-dependent protein kinase N-terminal coiled-coil domain-containing protein n=1 Tax=Elysia marginata TaxID=1093978 RepID=A0AAV4IBK0_9GAST|nr:hypothetical protein ElyMa_006557000 [Elysia marginata]